MERAHLSDRYSIVDWSEAHSAEDLCGGFFEGWPNPPSPEAHAQMLSGSYRALIAVDRETAQVVGFITAVSDGVSAAYIPHLEVLSAHRGEGLGKALVLEMIDRLRHLYMVDLVCDDSVAEFYVPLGFHRINGMVLRNYDRQACD